MRVMNGRLHNLARSPLIINKYFNNKDKRHSSQNNRHHHHNRTNSSKMNKPPLRRRTMSTELPKSVQFDESSDDYRCLCGCFHVKTGAFFIAGIELLMILCYFINGVLVLLQQRSAYGSQSNNDSSKTETSGDYVPVAFTLTTISLAIALLTIILMFVGLTRNTSSFLIPHLLVQAISILCFFCLILTGIVALTTDNTFLYRLLNATPFNDYPGQNTVSFSIESMVRIYAVFAFYIISFVLELWFILTVYNCYTYFTERCTYMNYCFAYSTPMKTLNIAR